MNNDDEELTLRDKFAIQILSSIIPIYYEYKKTEHISATNEKYEHRVGVLDNFIGTTEEEFNEKLQGEFESTTRLVRVSYRIADIMRKVRLGSFE